LDAALIVDLLPVCRNIGEDRERGDDRGRKLVLLLLVRARVASAKEGCQCNNAEREVSKWMQHVETLFGLAASASN
jgi:hypothetical protein